MSFEIICHACGAPSSPTTGICPYCKSAMSTQDPNEEESPTIRRLSELWQTGDLESAILMIHTAEKVQSKIISKANFALIATKVLIEADGPEAKIKSILNHALIDNPDHAELLDYLEIITAQSQLDSTKNDAGEIHLQSLIRRSPNNVHALFILGSHLFWVEKEASRAFKLLERSVQLRPEFLRASACLGAVYQNVGMLAPAKKIFLRCAKMETQTSMKKYFKELAAKC